MSKINQTTVGRKIEKSQGAGDAEPLLPCNSIPVPLIDQ